MARWRIEKETEGRNSTSRASDLVSIRAPASVHTTLFSDGRQMERRSGGFEVERNKAQRRGRLTVKERIQETVAALPDNVTVEQSIERLYFLAKVERGIEEADAGKLVPHDEAKRRLLR